jgi:hypothetical protein
MARQLRPGQLSPVGIYNITASFAATASAATSFQNQDVVINVQPGTASFLLTSASIQLLQVTNTGVLILPTQSAELTGSAPIGAMYFTSSSFFVGLE